jgi:hypothetical protein
MRGETGDQLSARDRQSRGGNIPGQKPIADDERLLQDRLHVGPERGVRMIDRDAVTPATGSA